MDISDSISRERIEHVHAVALSIGEVAVAFARVQRAPRMPDGLRETDVEHSFHLGLTAVELAAMLYPHLDRGLIMQFAQVHDLPEVITGDVWTMDITDEQRADKEERESRATERLLETLPPYLAELLRRYEDQTEPEARFVRLVDKCAPAILAMVSPDSSTFIDDYGFDRQTFDQAAGRNSKRVHAMFPEFPEMLDIYDSFRHAQRSIHFTD